MGVRQADALTLARLALAGLLAAIPLEPGPAAAKRSRPAPCVAARYELAGDPLGRDPATTTTVDVGGEVALGATCPSPGRTIVRTTRAGVTRVHARWRSCPGLPGRVALKARIVDECTRLVGSVRARRLRRRVEAARADCGDGVLEVTPPPEPYVATPESLATHALPRWFDDAKFGIMIHWGIFTIPAWAETIVDPADWLGPEGRLIDPAEGYGAEWFLHIPYVEWYWNTILIDGSPAQAHHHATYGADFQYEGFRPAFESAATAWSADPWVALFREARARYVVLVTKHHDGFALWPTALPHPRRPGWHSARDYVGELTRAVRRGCMRMGLYYSGGLDWSVQPGPMRNAIDILNVAPLSSEYIAYADGQWRELIDRYRPAVLWNDIGYPPAADALALLAEYYNRVPDGLVNDRFTYLPPRIQHDFFTPEFTVLADTSAEKFETVRGMGRGFGYNRNETETDYDSAATLIHLLVDVVSKNGNLLLNVGPMADGTIPTPQVDRLRAMGRWLDVNGEAIFGTRPWTRPTGATTDATQVRFTASGDGRTVYAIVLAPPAAGPVTIADLDVAPAEVQVLGSASLATTWEAGATGLRVDVPADLAAQPAYVVAIQLGE